MKKRFLAMLLAGAMVMGACGMWKFRKFEGNNE